MDGIRLYPDSVRHGIWRILEPLSGGHRVGLGLYPFNVLLGKRFLRDVLSPWSGEGSLLNVLNPWVSDWLLWDIFEISVFNGRRLEDLNMLNWVGWRNHSLHGLVGSVVDLVPTVIDDGSEVIEGVGIVEVGVADSWGAPGGLSDHGRLDDNNVIVGVGVEEVVVVEVTSSDATSNLGEGWVLGQHWEVIARVVVVEVGIGDSRVGVCDWCLDSSVNQDRVVVGWDVVEEVEV